MENRDNILLDSYWEWDFELWGNCQRELSSSVTAGVDDGVVLPALPAIVDVEASDDVLSEASLFCEEQIYRPLYRGFAKFK